MQQQTDQQQQARTETIATAWVRGERCQRLKGGANWIHQGGIYDGLLMLIGLPLAIWFDVKISRFFEINSQLPQVLKVGIYVYAFFLALNVFRMLFSYTRWVFPKIEINSCIHILCVNAAIGPLL